MSKHALPEFAPARIETSPFETGTEGQLWERIAETAEARLAALPPRDREELRDRTADRLMPPTVTEEIRNRWGDLVFSRTYIEEPDHLSVRWS